MQRTANDLAEVAARLRAEGPLKVSVAAKLVPADNRRGHVGAGVLVRWIVAGKKGVRLDGARFSGKTWWTSVAALERFWGSLAAADVAQVVAAGSRETWREREAREAEAEREADELFGV
jgi:hypothetical protein